MSDFDPSRLEAELRALVPARPPRHLLNKTLECLSPSEVENPDWSWHDALGWLIPALGLGLIALFVLILPSAWVRRPAAHLPAAFTSLKADRVEINRQLLANYDAVGRLPTGEPVRFRCAQWVDKVSVSDSAAGFRIERTIPRLEIVPIGFETY
jgi:hypothetical protein